MTEKREHWASRLGFVMAAAGSAVGLGNVWKFPYITGVYGGAAFILVYLLCILLLGLPIMIAEFVIGRHTGKNPVGAFKKMAGKGPWALVGYLGVASGFMILSFYSVVGGWTMAYIVKSVTGYLHQVSSPESAAVVFSQFSSNPWATVFYHFLFMAATMVIVIRGIKSGIERWNNILMPMIFMILIILIIKGLSMENAKLGLMFLFKPDFAKLTPQAVIVALGHSFFTLSLGMGCMITYGSYLHKKEKIIGAAVYIVIIDTLVALFSGIAIFTAVFALGMKPDKGPALIFNVIPAVFAQVPFGAFFSTIFFILLFIAALTSSISLLEVVVAYFIDEKGWSRRKAVYVFGIIIFLLGVPSALSTGVMKNFTFHGKTFFDIVDFTASNIMLPVGGFFIAVFLGWKYGISKTMHELDNDIRAELFKKIWAFVLKYISPLLLLAVFISLIMG